MITIPIITMTPRPAGTFSGCLILAVGLAWMRAGVSEDGTWSKTDVGTPQGAAISPLLANIFLHYVFDLWVRRWRHRRGI